ncbi:MAG: DUF3194 domain-containing protein [Haloarculaceae archaeon]
MSDADAESDRGPTDREVVEAASEAAEGLVLSRYKQSEVEDLDVTVSFEDGVLEVDVYLNAPDETADPEQVAQDAVRAAEAAVDELFAGAREEA